jgi:hypothetical protein
LDREFEEILFSIEKYIEIPKNTTKNVVELKRIVFLNMLFREMNLNFNMHVVDNKIFAEHLKIDYKEKIK